MYNITFQQIETFLTVARYLNMSRAAESLYISQPTLSKTLQRFESGVGFQVFTRSNQGVALTPQGEFLFNAFDSLYNNMSTAIKSARDLSPESKRTLRIVVPSSYDAVEDYNPLKRYVREYLEKYPNVTLREQLCDFRELRWQLEFGEADIAFSHNFAVSDIPRVTYKRISEYTLWLAMSEQHPLAAYDALQPDRLSEVTFYAVPQSTESVAAESIIRRCNEYGFTPKHIEFLENFPTLLHLLSEQRGVSICGRFKKATSNDLKYLSLPSETNRTYVVVAWYPDRLTKEARNFINMLPEDELEV
jgi:DNA-binding transcriptional LysR family regulator